jgi:hypothetical protein
LTQWFCRECGAKLDHQDVPVEDIAGKRQGIRDALWKAVHMSVVLSLLGLVVLALWPAKSPGAMGTDSQGRAYHVKVAQLYDACMTGNPLQVTVTEEEINRYLRLMVDRQRSKEPSQGFVAVQLDDIRMAVDRDAVGVAARVKWGPIPLVYGMSGSPEKAPGAFRMRVDQARLGLLPVPPPLAEWLVVSKLRTIFQGLDTETEVLRRISVLQLGAGMVRAGTGAR